MAIKEDNLQKIISHAKEYGFVFQSSEIYDGLSATYDYGQNGVELKNNIRNYWWKAMTQINDKVVGLDSAIFMHPKIWQASGHVDSFNDPMIDNKDSKKRYRADELIENYIAKIEAKTEKEIKKAQKKFGESFNRNEFLNTNPKVIKNTEKVEFIQKEFSKAMEENNLDKVRQIILDLGIACPISGTKNWTEVRQFNLMFSTRVGATKDDATDIYLRPETAQGIFVNFLNVQKTARMKIPFGIAQTGKAFRNEIVARQFIMRMREFEQMEMQFFVRPKTEKEWFEYWKDFRLKWHKAMGIDDEMYRIKDHDKLAHYANAAADIEFKFPIGFKEIEGIHSRTDFDLSQHQEFSGKKLKYYDEQIKESYIPYVIETSIGLDRIFFALLANSLKDEIVDKDKGTNRTVLKLPPELAPIKLAIFPLLKKDGLSQKAKQIFDEMKFDYKCNYEEKDTIGKRYRRHDAIGTPYCITVDHQTLKDNTVTLRYRDSMKQERIEINKLKEKMNQKLNINNLLKKLV